MLLRKQLVPKASISLYKSLFTVYVAQPYTKTESTSDFRIHLLYIENAMLNEFITP